MNERRRAILVRAARVALLLPRSNTAPGFVPPIPGAVTDHMGGNSVRTT